MGFLGVYKAIYDYAPQGESELAITEGDILYVLEKSGEDDWWKAKKKASGDDDDEPVGLIPNNYIEEVRKQQWRFFSCQDPAVEVLTRSTSSHDLDCRETSYCKITDFGDRHNLHTTHALSTTIPDRPTKNSRSRRTHNWRSLIHRIQIGYWLVLMENMALRQRITSSYRMKHPLQNRPRPAFQDGPLHKLRKTMNHQSHLEALFRALRRLWQVS